MRWDVLFYNMDNQYLSNFVLLLRKTFTKRNLVKLAIVLPIGLVGRWFINDFFDINVFIDYTNHISIVYYSFMGILSVFINELLNLLDGQKFTLGGDSLPFGIDNKNDIKVGKRFVPSILKMEGSPEQGGSSSQGEGGNSTGEGVAVDWTLF